MTQALGYLAISTGLALAVCLAVYAAYAAQRDPYGRAVDRFIDNRMAAGFTFGESHDLLTLQRELAALRTRASDRVVVSPRDWIRILDEEKAAGVKRLAYSRQLARRFGEAVSGLPYNHVLYADAARAAERFMPNPGRFTPTADDWAALRVVRPS